MKQKNLKEMTAQDKESLSIYWLYRSNEYMGNKECSVL